MRCTIKCQVVIKINKWRLYCYNLKTFDIYIENLQRIMIRISLKKSEMELQFFSASLEHNL